MDKLPTPKYKVGDLIYAEIGRHKRKYAGTIMALKYHWTDSEYDKDGWFYKVPKESYIDYVSEDEIIEPTPPLSGKDGA